MQQQEDWQPVPKETPVFRNVPVANPADLVALKEERPPLPPIKRPVTPPPTMQIQGGPTGFYTESRIIHLLATRGIPVGPELGKINDL